MSATLIELRGALTERTRLEDAFKQNVINKISTILNRLELCNVPAGTPAANALDLTRDELARFIDELRRADNLNDAAAINLVNDAVGQRRDLRRVTGAPNAQPQSRGWWQIFSRSAPAPPSSTSNPIRTSVNDFRGSTDRSNSTDPFQPDRDFDRELRLPGSVRAGPGAPSGRIGGSRKSKRARKTRKN